MENFQLYRTNLILGGQLKWDIIVDSAYSKLYVADFHMSPISNSIPYIYKNDENLLRNTHQDNVKEYFKNISGYFYDEGIDSNFINNWPLISKKSEIIDTYCNTYDMGCRRINSYKRYNKQFEFFCPVWLEKIDDDISFLISIKEKNSNTILSKNALKLFYNNIKEHDAFVKYFNEYIKSAKLDIGCDDLANINIKKQIGKFSGLNASTGLFEVISSDSIVNNITLRERPLMEFDSMIIDSFKDNNLIAKQLFNFNLCFNIQDIVSGSIFKLMKGQSLIVSVDVMIGEKLLEKKDFYTEYDFIPKHITSNVKITENYNVLDYLHDYESIDLIDKNKFCQKICHWSLTDNNDYIFNLYNGFSGLNINKTCSNTSIIENTHQYKNASNTYIKFADDSLNSTGWINTYKINSWNEFNEYVSNPDLYKKLNATHISKNKKYINNLKYKDLSFIDKDFYIVGLEITNNKIFSIIKSNYGEYIADICDGKLFMMLIDDLMIIFTNDANYLVYGTFQKILEIHKENDFKDIKIITSIKSNSSEDNIEIYEEQLDGIFEEVTGNLIITGDIDSNYSNSGIVEIYGNINNDNESIIYYISTIYKLMCNKIDPELILFGSSLLYNNADSPSKNSTEIKYIKDNGVRDYVIRYDGKIKPTFVDHNGTLYYKDYISDDRTEGKSNLQKSDYIKYINSGYIPLYPSINYCAIKKLNDWNYNELPKSEVSEYNNKVNIHGNSVEYSWFNNGISLMLLPELELTHVRINAEDENSKKTEEIIKEEISNFYNITDSKVINYIVSKYDIETNWDYLSDTNIKDYIYYIKLKLK